MKLLQILTETAAAKPTFTVDLSQLRCRNGVYHGVAVVNGKSKEAYGTDGAVSNILDEVTYMIEDALGAYFNDGFALRCGKKYRISLADGNLQVRPLQ